MIFLFFNYQIWSQKFELLIRQEARQIILRDINPQFIVMELLNSLQAQNRVESYHYERAAIAQVGGRKQLTGRTDIAIEISNQCGSLLANVINHYNSSILSKLLEKYEASGNQKGLAMLSKISPVAWGHIHFQGHFKLSDDVLIDLDAIIDGLIEK